MENGRDESGLLGRHVVAVTDSRGRGGGCRGKTNLLEGMYVVQRLMT